MTSSTTTNADASARKSSIPTLLTVFRIAMGPVVAVLVLWSAALFYSNPQTAAVIFGAALALFILAAVTDWLDGWAARKLNAITPLGAALDHAADKVLITCVLVALAYAALPMDLVLASVLILGRDVAIAGLREGISAQGKQLPVGQLGKWKAAAEMCGVAAFMAFQTAALLNQSAVLVLGLQLGARILLWSAAVLALVSAAQYVATLLKRT